MEAVAQASSSNRLLQLIKIAHWVALTVGIMAAVISTEAATESLAASAAAGLYVLVVATLPERILERPFVIEAVSLAGALATLLAVVITGGIASPFLLMSVMPCLLAGSVGGFRTGVATGSLSGGLIVAVALTVPDKPLGSALGMAGLYLVLAATVAQIRRLLRDVHTRAAEFEESSAAARMRLAQLEAAHNLLNQVAELTSGRDTNPVSVGRAALEGLTARFAGSSGVAALRGPDGPVIVARIGEADPEHSRYTIPLRIGDREVGTVVFSTEQPLSPEDLEEVEEDLRPLALAFSNLLLLQTIAQNAVQEERARLARELHDEIGPSLASLGLALDVAILQNPTEPALMSHLSHLRAGVEEIVEDIRSTVADLRTRPRGSLTEILNTLAGEFTHGPPVEVALDERRPPRPSMTDQLVAIVNEAVRNAARHAGASSIVVGGWVDFDRGRVVVADDGKGFDPNGSYPGHFGLVGMQERAKEIGAELSIISDEQGTRVAIEWGDQ